MGLSTGTNSCLPDWHRSGNPAKTSSNVLYSHLMRATRGTTVAAILIASASAVAGCGSPPGAKTSAPTSHQPGQANVSAALYRSPKQATLSWFFAINHKDKAAAIAHFEPAAADQMSWGNGDTSTWATFSALHCTQVSRSATTASVYCTFKESQAPSVGQPSSFWTVYLHRQSNGRWLITNYGQG